MRCTIWPIGSVARPTGLSRYNILEETFNHKSMSSNENVTEVANLATQGLEAIKALWERATPEERQQILKILGAIGGFALLLKFLQQLK